jgi:hypothetical protein
MNTNLVNKIKKIDLEILVTIDEIDKIPEMENELLMKLSRLNSLRIKTLEDEKVNSLKKAIEGSEKEVK